MRFKSATESLTKPSQINTLRRSIARITTILHERATGVRGQESK
jgi:ribosomal protein L29